MKCSYKLRKYHDVRLEKTNIKLLEALARMVNDAPQTVGIIKWTKHCWATEAGVNVNTAVSKVNGKFIFAEANRLFEQAKAAQVAEGSSLKAQIKHLQMENQMLKREIAALHRARSQS